MLKSPSKSVAERPKEITVIYDPEKQKEQSIDFMPIRKKKVAAYARVSTELDAQQNSYEAQINYYTEYIQNKPEWEFVGVYADEGITGTSTKKRDGFMKMIEDAEAGKIDLILTKSISRFSRNTVDALTETRRLKAKGVEVYFEKENISSMNAQAELIFTILCSTAQDESRSISENVVWGQRRNMEAGKVSVAWSHFLGYEKGPDGTPQIVEEQAKIVHRIYNDFLSGKSPAEIAKDLTAEGIKTPAGKDKWSGAGVQRILTNEKYKGDAILQKTYTVDYLTKEVRKNTGQRKQWYVKNSHPAIIAPETFELVQQELERRYHNGGIRANSHFSRKLICGECGAYYGHKVWNSTKPCRKYVWFCNRKYDGDKVCSTPKVEDHEVKTAFLIAVNMLTSAHPEFFTDYYKEFIDQIGNTKPLEKQLEQLQEKQAKQYEEAEKLLQDNATRFQDQEEYNRKFNARCSELDQTKAEIATVKEQISEALSRRKNAEIFLKAIHETGPEIYQFDDAVWQNLIDHAVVTPEKEIVFYFRIGKEITVPLEEAH